jgi:hypothetical protein
MNVCRRTRVGAWGHEFVRNLAGEIGAEFNERTTAEPRGDVTDLLKERSPLGLSSTALRWPTALLHGCRRSESHFAFAVVASLLSNPLGR